MGLFDSKKIASSLSGSLTLIAEEAYFHGVLSAKGSLRIEGRVEGDVSDASAVEIGRKGRVKGDVAAETVSVAGEVEGDVSAARSVEILAQGKVRGNIRTPSLRIEEGAFFEGQCAMASYSGLEKASLEEQGEGGEAVPVHSSKR